MFGFSIWNNNIKSSTLLVILFLISVRLSAQGGESVSACFVSKSGDSLRYQFVVPNDLDTSKKYPLVIWLHGKGERGVDNQLHMTHIKKWLPDSLKKDEYKAFLLAPQCTEKQMWSNYDKTAQQITFDTITPEIQTTLMNLMDSLSKLYPIDTSRFYIIGISMGGFGVFDLITRYPDRFAAAVPVCGGADPNQTEKLVKTPIWAFHGGNDKIVDKRHTVVPMEKIKDESHKLTIYPSVGHDAWNKAFKEPELLKWMFSQTKSEN